MKNLGALSYNGKAYRAVLWEPGDAIPEEPRVGVDTETTLIVDHTVPDLVCMQVAYPISRIVHLVWWSNSVEYLRDFHHRNPTTELHMHNCSFDLSVLHWRDNPFLKPYVMNNLVRDTGVRELLKSLRDGSGTAHYPALAALCKKHHKEEMDKKGSVRLTFSRGMILDQDHAIYAVKDAIATIELYFRGLPGDYPTEDIQVRAMIVLDDIGRNGMQVDMVKFQQLRSMYIQREQEALAVLSVFGYIPGLSGNRTVLQDILEMIERMCDFKFERTEKTNAICTSDDKLVNLDVRHPFFLAYKEYIHVHKMLSTYLNEKLIGTDGRVHPRFNVLVRTGRTSCGGPNLQNIPSEGGLRNQYIAAPGKVLVAIDYGQLEICTLAQANKILYGFSDQGDKLNAGIDIHCDLASVRYKVPYEEMYNGYKSGDPEWKKKRNTAKPGNFGFPGGMGLETVVNTAKKDGIDMSMEDAQAYKQAWLQYREMALHMNPPVDDYWTERNVVAYCRKKGIQLSKPSPEALQNELLRRALEEAVGEGLEGVPREKAREIELEIRDLKKYIGLVPTGRIRRNCTFTSACNTKFQGFAADGGKDALWDVYMDDWKIVDFIHDEIIVELDEDENLHENVERIKELMIGAMKRYVPDYRITVEAAAMRVWYKEAAEVLDEKGRLLVWEPPMSDTSGGFDFDLTG